MIDVIEPVGVVGAGVMGVGVGQDLAQCGISATLVDVSEDALAHARTGIARGVRAQAMFSKGGRGEATAAVLDRLTFSADYQSLAGCGFVIENVTEDLGVKEGVYRELDRVCRKDCIFIANTSCIPIARLAAFTGRAPGVIGVHFMNPVPLKPTVEMIAGAETAAETVQRTKDLLAAMGKEWIQVNDSPGFVSNRVLMLTINEAVHVLEDDVASAETVDAVFKSCFGHRMGPLETADLIGLDTILNSLLVLLECFGDAKYQPAPLLRRMVDSGRLGRKSGAGFHDYA